MNDIKSQIRVRMLGASNGSVVPIDKAISIASVECARLFAEVERVRNYAERMDALAEERLIEVERLRGLNHAQHDEYERLERRITTLQAQVEALREALAVGIHHDNCETDDECMWVDMARKTLATPAQEEEDKPLFEGKWTGVMGPVEEDK